MNGKPKLNPILQIDDEFEGKIPPLTDDEYRQLEENIVSEGAVLMPLIVWDGTIVDGHNRYRIALAHPEVIYTALEKDFDNRYEALAWICRNQLGRRNLTPQQKKYLIGERYDAEKMSLSSRGNQHTPPDESACDEIRHKQNRRTRKAIASETGTSEGYVQDAADYAKGVNAAEEASPGIKQDILSGNVKATQKEVRSITKASPEERRQLVEALRHPPASCKDNNAQKQKMKTKPTAMHTSASGSRKASAAAIEKISEDMARPKPRLTPQGAVKQFEWKVTVTLQDFDSIFGEWPQLISEEAYREQVVKTLGDLKQYIMHIEGGTLYEWNHDERKIV